MFMYNLSETIEAYDKMQASDVLCLLQQEPGANGTEILNCLKYVRPGHGFEPNFELTAKIDVNGPNEHPLYSFLKVRVIFVEIYVRVNNVDAAAALHHVGL